MLLSSPNSWATFDAARQHRFNLGRRWNQGLAALAWTMLNPSIAGDVENDQTIRVIMEFSRRMGYGGIYVVNLFTLVSTHPDILRRHYRPGHDFRREDEEIITAAKSCPLVMCAWGNNGDLLDRGRDVARLIRKHSKLPPACLGVTNSGQPVHPLRQPYNVKIMPLRM